MAEPSAIAAFDQHEHDHGQCVRDAVATAEAVCARDGAKLTPIRRRVLEIIWTRRTPMGAYEVLDEIGKERGRVAPPTVYRAIDFLRAHGLIHRIESLNAYVGCPDPRARHHGYFLICSQCSASAELTDPRIDDALHAGAAEVGFTIERQMVELSGRCPACSGGA